MPTSTGIAKSRALTTTTDSVTTLPTATVSLSEGHHPLTSPIRYRRWGTIINGVARNAGFASSKDRRARYSGVSWMNAVIQALLLIVLRLAMVKFVVAASYYTHNAFIHWGSTFMFHSAAWS